MKKITDLEKLTSKVDEAIEEKIKAPLTDDDDNYSDDTPADLGKSRIWIMLLYPDDPDHQKILSTIYTDFPSAVGALHDEDIFERDIPKRGIKRGDKKKPHYHIVLYFPNQVYRSHVTEKYAWYSEIDRFIHARKDIKFQVRYLLHLDNPEKYQYPNTYLEGNVSAYLKYFDKERKELDDAQSILFIIKYETPFTLMDLIQQCIDKGLYSAYRRNAYTFNLLLREAQEIAELRERRKGL